MVDLVNEIFEKVNEAPTKLEKNQLLNFYINKYPNFGVLCKYMFGFGEECVFDVDVPEYNESHNPSGLGELLLVIEARRLYVFLKETNLSKKRKTEILLQILEALHPEEAKIVVKLLSGTLKLKGYTKKDWMEFVKVKVAFMQQQKAKLTAQQNHG
jgi:hypothetical protein